MSGQEISKYLHKQLREIEDLEAKPRKSWLDEYYILERLRNLENLVAHIKKILARKGKVEVKKKESKK